MAAAMLLCMLSSCTYSPSPIRVDRCYASDSPSGLPDDSRIYATLTDESARTIIMTELQVYGGSNLPFIRHDSFSIRFRDEIKSRETASINQKTNDAEYEFLSMSKWEIRCSVRSVLFADKTKWQAAR